MPPFSTLRGQAGSRICCYALGVEPIVCSCLNVSEADVKRAIDNGAGSIAEVGDACEAGTGCTTCHEAIAYMLEKKARTELRHGRAPVQLRQLGIFGSERPPPPRSHVKPKASDGE